MPQWEPQTILKEDKRIMAGKLKIRTLSNWSIFVTVFLAVLCIMAAFFGSKKYTALHQATQDYIACEAAAWKLQEGSDTLTKQARLAAVTGEQKYIDAYFEEANVTKSREAALSSLETLQGDPAAMELLQEALTASMKLMQTEYYAMRLIEEAMHVEISQWPDEIRSVELSIEDASLPETGKMSRAQELLGDLEYESVK